MDPRALPSSRTKGGYRRDQEKNYPRPRQINASFSNEQYDAIAKRAADLGLTVTSYVYLCVLTMLEEPLV